MNKLLELGRSFSMTTPVPACSKSVHDDGPKGKLFKALDYGSAELGPKASCRDPSLLAGPFLRAPISVTYTVIQN
jgi:hypothetical protein